MSDSENTFKVQDLFRLYRATNELVHGEEDVDLEAPVKFIEHGTEFLVTELRMEVNPETNETVIWLSGVIDE